jgi:hypothetical protein
MNGLFWYLGRMYRILRSTRKSTWLIGEHRKTSRSSSITFYEIQKWRATRYLWRNKLKLIECGTPTSKWLREFIQTAVLNHWFYILTIGKTGTNDIGNSYNVTGINIDKAAKIAYRLESVYLC